MLWVFICILVLAVLLLSIKMHLMQKAAMEINAQFDEKLAADTNTLIRISGHDRYMLKLAADINVQRRRLKHFFIGKRRNSFFQSCFPLKRASCHAAFQPLLYGGIRRELYRPRSFHRQGSDRKNERRNYCKLEKRNILHFHFFPGQ